MKNNDNLKDIKDIDIKQNLYWPIYQTLENELLNITNYIKFDDTQLKVYSNKFVDLLLRICVEIESISKDLYLDNNGPKIEPETEMYFDTICLNFLEEKWCLSEKIVQIINPNIYFSKKTSLLKPLKKANKRGSSGCKWKQAYQAVKHNRNMNYCKGNLENCINSLAALYILNIYYKNKVFELKNDFDVNNFDLSQGSNLFAIKTYKENDFYTTTQKDTSATYIINYTDKFIQKFKEKNDEINKIYFEQALNDPKILETIKNKETNIEKLIEDTKTIGLKDIIEIIGTNTHIQYMKFAVQKVNIHALLNKMEYIAYLNTENNTN